VIVPYRSTCVFSDCAARGQSLVLSPLASDMVKDRLRDSCLHSLGAKTEITHNMVKPRVEERDCNTSNDQGPELEGGPARRAVFYEACRTCA
jgi:hypothetical protein